MKYFRPEYFASDTRSDRTSTAGVPLGTSRSADPRRDDVDEVKDDGYKAFSLPEMAVVLIVLSILLSAVLAGTKLIRKSRISTAQNLTANSPVAKIDNLVLWLEPTLDDSFREKEIAVTNPTISRWFDLNPDSAKNDAAQGTSDNYPLYLKNGINNLPAVRFQDGKFLSFDGSKIANSNFTIFVVEKRLAGDSDNYFITTASGNFKIGYETDTTITLNSGTSCSFSNIPSFANDTSAKIHVFRLRATPTLPLEYTRLANPTTARQDPTNINCTPPSSVNQASISSNTNGYNGMVGEIIIFNRSLKDEEMYDIENYLITKWKIQEN